MLRYPGCVGWHGTGGFRWLDGGGYGFVRGRGGVFRFTNDFWDNSGGNCSRGVAVVGTGL